MPKLSAFNPCGMLRMSSAPSYAKAIYDTIVSGEKEAFDNTKGGARESRNYAMAMGIARARCAMERAGNQVDPHNCNDLLPDFEKRFGLVPGPYDTIVDRQNALATKMQFSQGARRSNVVNVLRRILGADFLALRGMDPAEIARVTNFDAHATDVRIAPRFLRLVDPIVRTAVPTWVLYENLDPTAGDVILSTNDVVMVQPGHSARQEKVTVLDARGTGATREFQATFQFAHDIGAIVTTMNFPYEWSTQRHLFVVVKHAAAIDPETRRKVHEVMRQLTRAVDTWSIVEPIGVGALLIGPFTLGVSSLDTTTLGQIAFVPEP